MNQILRQDYERAMRTTSGHHKSSRNNLNFLQEVAMRLDKAKAWDELNRLLEYIYFLTDGFRDTLPWTPERIRRIWRG